MLTSSKKRSATLPRALPDRQVWTVYILKCADGTLYTGVTNDLGRRLEKHTNGTGAKYTRGRGPFKLLYTEMKRTKGGALKREAEIKSWSRVEKLAFIAGKKKPAAKT